MSQLTEARRTPKWTRHIGICNSEHNLKDMNQWQHTGMSKVLDFKLSPCSECCILSFGWFPGVWILCADVSKHPICSIFIVGVGRKKNWDEVARVFIQIKAIPRLLNFMCRRFETPCLFHLHSWCKQEEKLGRGCQSIYTGKGDSLASEFYVPTFRNTLYVLSS